jgi:hypothetical protein
MSNMQVSMSTMQ